MAATLGKLIIFVLFLSFQPITSEEDVDQKEFHVEDNSHQNVKEDLTTGIKSEEDRQDEASAAENAESKGSPSFFSQVFSELAAPLYEEEESDFLNEEAATSSQDNSIEDDNNKNKEEEEGAEENSNGNPEELQENVENTYEEKEQSEIPLPQFTVATYLKSITEDSQTARTAINSENEEAKIIWPDVASVPYVSSEKDSESARTVDSESETGNNINDDEEQYHQGNSNSSSVKELNQLEPPTSSELSDEDLEHLRVKSKDSTKDEVGTPKEKVNPDEEDMKEAPEFDQEEAASESLETETKQVEKEEKFKQVDEGDVPDFLGAKHKAPADKNVVNTQQAKDLEVEMTKEALDLDQEKADRGEFPHIGGHRTKGASELDKKQVGQGESPNPEDDRSRGALDQQTNQGELPDSRDHRTRGPSELDKKQGDQGESPNSRDHRTRGTLELNQKQADQKKAPDPRFPDAEMERIPKNNATFERTEMPDAGKQMVKDKSEENLQMKRTVLAEDPSVERSNDSPELGQGKTMAGKSDDEMKPVVQNNKLEKQGERKHMDEGTKKMLVEQGERKDAEEELKQQQEEKKRKYEEDRLKRLESLKKQLKEVEQHEKMVEERNKRSEEDHQQKLEGLGKHKDEGGLHAKTAEEQGEMEIPKKNEEKNPGGNRIKEEMQVRKNGEPPGEAKPGTLGKRNEKLPKKREEKLNVKPYKVHMHGQHDGKVPQTNKEAQPAGKSHGSDDEEHRMKGAKLDEEEAALKMRLEILKEERRKYEQMAQQYKTSKHGKQPKVQKEKEHTKHRSAEESQKSPVKEQKVPAKVDQASILLPVSVTSITNSWTPTPSLKKIAPTKTDTSTPVSTSTTKTTPDLVLLTKEMIQPTATTTTTSTASVTESSRVHTVKVSYPEGAEVTVPPKVILGETQPLENASQTNNTTISAYAVFMRAFRGFHESSFQALLSYWPAMRTSTRDLLSYVGLDAAFEQLCDDLAVVHPAVLFGTFLCGALGILYFLWSFTLRGTRQGARGPHLRDVLKSQQARIRILEEEVKASQMKEMKAYNDRDQAVKLKCVYEDQVEDGKRELKRLLKALDVLQKEKQNVDEGMERISQSHAESQAEVQEKDRRILECENKISELEMAVEAKQAEIGQVKSDIQRHQEEIEASQQLINELNNKIQQGDGEIKKLESELQEAKDRKQSLQVEFDDQLLRMTELQQQYNFKCDEAEVLKDCLKQIKGNSEDDEDKEETDPQEMEKRLEDMMNVTKAKAEAEKAIQDRDTLATQFDEQSRTNRMLQDELEEIKEKLVHLQSKADQASLSLREKEIELGALNKYFKSTEVELHRKLTAEESARINTENQLQSEQAKASTAVVDADKYRQLYLDVKKQIEEIDQNTKEQLSNMEAKAHQNWLDYRTAAKERDALKDENDLLRRKIYDMEMRGSRPGSSASSSQMNHVDGRDSPRQSPHMVGPPGHGSPVPFVPMMGPPPPPPPSMFPGQRRHPAEMLMNSPRPPFPPPGHATPPPTTSTPQPSKPDDRDIKDSAPHLPPPPPPPMSGYGPRPLPPMMGMPRFPLRPPMIPPPVSGGQGPLPPPPPLPSMLRGPLPPPMPGPRPSS